MGALRFLSIFLAGCLAATLCTCSGPNNFTVTPQSLIATEGSSVTFYCHNTDALLHVWYINGSLLSQLPSPQQTTISTGSEFISEGNRVFYLRFIAQRMFNNSLIVCEAFRSESQVYSNPATLLIQGQLDEVEHLTVTVTTNFSIFIDWIAPFSLAVTQTNTETGIISYCVEVYNSSNQEILVSVCDLSYTHYVYSQQDLMYTPSPCDSVDVVVIPVSSAGNGSSSHSRGAFYNGPEKFLVFDLDVYPMNIGENDLSIRITNISQLDITCSCSICINLSNLETCYTGFCDNIQGQFYLLNIRRRTMIIFQVILQNSAGSATSNRRILSSYDLQGINVNSIMLSGTMEIDLHYLANSSTTGCLLILSQGQYTRYLAVRRPVGKDTQSVQLEGLPQGSYTISGYDVGKKRLSYDSVAMAAVTVRNITLEQRTAFWKQAITSPNISIHPDESSVCVTCISNGSSASLGCVVLLHPVNNFSTITVREIGRNSSQPYCIYMLGKGKFSTAVFEWKSDGFASFEPVSVTEVLVSKEQAVKKGISTLHIVLVSSLPAALVVVTTATLCIIALKCRNQIKAKQTNVIYSDPREATDPTEAIDMTMNNNKAYAVPQHYPAATPIYEYIEQ